jgi:hypothetical protein
MSRAFTLAGAAIALVSLAGTADQARANAAGAMAIAGKQAVALLAPVGRVIVEQAMGRATEAVLVIGLEKVLGVTKNGEPIPAASPDLALKGKSLSLDVQ